MIPRYTRHEMGRIWDPETKYQKWLDIEIAVCEAWAELGEIPKDVLKEIKKRAQFDIKRIDEIAKVVKHDVIAFLTSVAQSLGPRLATPTGWSGCSATSTATAESNPGLDGPAGRWSSAPVTLVTNPAGIMAHLAAHFAAGFGVDPR